jgi:hypothetical protein
MKDGVRSWLFTAAAIVFLIFLGMVFTIGIMYFIAQFA